MTTQPTIPKLLAFFAPRFANTQHPVRFVEGIDIFDAPDGIGVFIRGLGESHLIRGGDVSHSLSLLRAALKSPSPIGEALEAIDSEDQRGVITLLGALDTMGAITLGDSPTLGAARDRQSTCSLMNPFGGDQVARKLKRTSVVVCSDGIIGAYIVRSLLDASISEIFWASTSTQPVGDVVPLHVENLSALLDECESATTKVQPDFVILQLGLAQDEHQIRFNDMIRRSNTNGLVVNDDLAGVVIGPLLEPSTLGCIRCYLLRRASAAKFAGYEALWNAQQDHTASSSHPSCPPELAACSAAFAVAQLVSLSARLQKPATLQAIVRFEHNSLMQSRHPIVPAASCELCG